MIDVDLVELSLTTDSLQLADVALLMAFGTPAGQIADRLHVKPNSVGMLLTRHGLPELARPFWREQEHRRPPTTRSHHRTRPLVIPAAPHGTWDRWRLHAALGEPPCASCAVAGAEHWRTAA